MIFKPSLNPSLRPAIEAQLEKWFAAEISRDSPVPWEDSPAWSAAAWMYKRGLRNIVFPSQKPSDGDVSAQNHSMKTRVQSLSEPELTEILHPLLQQGNIFWVVDQNVQNAFLRIVEENKSTKPPPPAHYLLDAAESEKTLATAWKILDAVPPQTKRIIAFGGGLTSDVAGFVAAMSGVSFSAVATTILAAIDAGVGGKTGVNHPCGKNQIGAFHPLEQLWCAPHLFSTLPKIERASGACEALKHAWLAGILPVGPAWEVLLNLGSSQTLPQAFLTQLVNVKLQLVEEDPLEHGRRLLLNFGHTLAHAWETAALRQGIYFPHGLAVGWGMRAKLRSFFAATPETPIFLNALETLLSQFPPPPEIAPEDAILLLAQDKKRKSDTLLRLSLPAFNELNSYATGFLELTPVEAAKLFTEQN